MKVPTEGEWAEWARHPVTKVQHKLLGQWVVELQRAWSSGQFTDLGQFGTAILNAKAIGACEAYQRVVNLEYGQVIGALTDNEE